MGLRDLVERHSATTVVFLHRLPGWVLPLVVAVLMLVGLFVHSWVGALALVALALFLGWFAYLSWPGLPWSGRLLRVGAVVLLLLFALGDITRF
ncbi:hypothetical protein LO762_18225 [Actinocorallia sp. API 0066]|uniref:DUF6703 family protein n=1 Tax=Actinocorallia sp. API 0066 TaxID=2896846 RepID=UPI001E53EA79|nr:DUF6703 family protein [Actinocorallia sp. API 0066]MCD0451120.1 hypothetical protein [Actinocorallia sp. API 0066]